MATTQQQETKPTPGPQKAPANGERDITAGFVTKRGILSNNDEVLTRQLGGDIALYREVLRDDQVQMSLSQRFGSLVSKEWVVEPGGESAIDKAAADFIRDQLIQINFDALTKKMLFGLWYGYSVAEIVYKLTDDSRIGWDQIIVRKRERFGYDKEGTLRLRTASDYADGEACDPLYFWSFAVGADNDDDPYGLGLAHWCYWPVFFKRAGIRFWMVFVEKFAQPTPIGTFPDGIDDDRKQALLDALSAVHTDGAVVIPESMSADLLEAARSGTADYGTLCRYMDAAIVKIILGQTLTSEVGSTGGNRALGEVHMEVRAEVIKADSDIICKSFVDGPVRILVEANFDGAKVPKIYRQIDPPTDRKTEVEVDAGLDRLGWERTEESFAEVYGDGYQRKPEPKLDPYGLPIGTGPARAPGQQMPQRQPAQRKAREFAAAEFPDQATLDHALDELDNGGGFDSLDGSLKPIFDFLEQHGPQETLARFVEFYALPMRSLQERLARVIFIADVWGRINARE